MDGHPYLLLEGLDKRFGDLHVIRDLSLAVERGEIFALLGPSGSGKTTALRLLAGFETPDAGRIRVDGQDVTALPPARRGFGMVFQHYALFPHLSVGENVAFGLETRGWSGERIARRVAEMLALVDLTGFEGRRLSQISGGQQQRVALARALAPEPRVLMLDEPLSNLDPALRGRTRRELRAAIRRVGITTFLVTHEQEEAFDLGDRVAVLAEGRLQQVGTPEDLYLRPAERFVATFVGHASVLPGVVEAVEGEAVTVRLEGGALWRGAAVGALAPGQAVELVARPESLRFVAEGVPGALSGQVTERRYAGPVTYYHVRLGAEAGSREAMVLAAADAAEVGRAVRVGPGGDGPAPRVFAGERR